MLLEASLALVALLAYLYWRWQQKSTYWTKLGVRQPPSNPFLVGNDALPRLLSAKNANRAMLEQYNQFKGEKYYGTYTPVSAIPILHLRDLDLMQHVMGKQERSTCI